MWLHQVQPQLVYMVPRIGLAQTADTQERCKANGQGACQSLTLTCRAGMARSLTNWILAIYLAGSAARTAGPPADWAPRVAALQMFYSPNETWFPANQVRVPCALLSCLCALTSPARPRAAQAAAVGNGYVATQMGTADVFLAGVFNGLSTSAPSHRARVPSTGMVFFFVVVCTAGSPNTRSLAVNVAIADGTVFACALDIERAMYLRRSAITSGARARRWLANTHAPRAGRRRPRDGGATVVRAWSDAEPPHYGSFCLARRRVQRGGCGDAGGQPGEWRCVCACVF